VPDHGVFGRGRAQRTQRVGMAAVQNGTVGHGRNEIGQRGNDDDEEKKDCRQAVDEMGAYGIRKSGDAPAQTAPRPDEQHDGGTAYTEDDGKTWTMLPEGSTVSMNMWGFSASILKELKDRFPKFLDENLKVNPLKCEYFLPFVVDELLGEKRATVKVLKSMDKWYGVTYKEDKPVVVAAIQNLKDGGLYPQKLWEE